MKHFKAAALILLAMVAGPVSAGVVFQIETTDHEASPPAVHTIQISAQEHRLMADLGAAGSAREGRVIFRGDRGEMVVVDDAEKSYFKLDRKQITAMAGQANEAMKQMEEALKSVPEAQRAAFEEMMKKRMPQSAAPKGPVTELKRTDERAEKNGYPCVRYDLLKDGRKISELWVTPWKNIAGADEVAGAFEEMGDFVRELTEAFSAAMGGAGGMAPRFGQEMFGQLSKLGGFPVYSREFADDGSLKAESNLRSAKQQNITADAFEPPAAYKPRTLFGG